MAPATSSKGKTRQTSAGPSVNYTFNEQADESTWTGKRADRSISTLEQQVFPDGDDSRDFEYDLEQPLAILYYEQGDLYEDYERKFRRLLSWMEEHKNVITFLSPRGEFQADVKQLEGRDDLATELRCQMISKVALKQQVDTLWRLVNTLEIQNRNNNDDQIRDREQNTQLRAEVRALKEQLREARRQGSAVRFVTQGEEDSDNPRATTEETAPTRSTTLTRAKEFRSPKVPDPPKFAGFHKEKDKDKDDEERIGYRAWRSQMRNKLLGNADWWENGDRIDPDYPLLAYTESRLKEEALDYYLSWIEPRRDAGLITSMMDFWEYMDGIYDDPDRAINARYQYHNLRMKYLQDFNEFRAQFARLAYTAGIPKDQWKLDIHHKLYDDLRLGMETKVSKESTTFEAYCEKAQQLARGLKQNADKKRVRETQRGRGGGSVGPILPARPMTTLKTAIPPTSRSNGGVKCYSCGQIGHIQRNCPRRKEAAGLKMIEPPSADLETASSWSGNGEA